jgi:hypothetical protein
MPQKSGRLFDCANRQIKGRERAGQVQLRDEQTGLSTHIPAAAQKIFSKNPPISKKLSGAGEFHPRALPEPDVNVSVHPAPIIPSPYGTIPICQWANKPLFRLA